MSRKQPYLSDPHLFYHLESPAKIAQLLDSGLYELSGNVLLSKETQEKLVISSFTL